MKRCFLLVLLALTISTLPACAAESDAPPSAVHLNPNDEMVTPVESDGIGISVDSASVTKSGLTYTLENTTETMIYMGDEFFIAQKQEDGQGEWTELPWIAGAPEWWKTLDGYGPFLSDTASVTEWSITIDWERIYGPLSAGEYLLVKEVVNMDDLALNDYIAAKFTVPAS